MIKIRITTSAIGIFFCLSLLCFRLPANPLQLWGPGRYKQKGRVEITGNPGKKYYVEVGPWTYWYQNGQKEKEGAFTRGVRTGPWRFWYDNEIRMKAGSFDRLGREEGLWKYWYRNGLPEKEGTYRAGIPDGHWTFWYDQPPPAREREGSFKAGKKDGFWVCWYPNGRKTREGNYLNDLEEGPWTYWYEDGDLKCAGGFSRGLEKGEWFFREKYGEGEDEKIREWKYVFNETEPYPGERKVETPADGLVGHWLTEKTLATMDRAASQPFNPNHIYLSPDGEAVEMMEGRLLKTKYVIEEEDPVARTVQVRFTLEHGKGAIIFGRFSEDYKQLIGRYYLVDFLRGSRGKLINPFVFTYAGAETGPDRED